MEFSGIKPADIAHALKLPEPLAWSFAHEIERQYKPARLQKVGKKFRTIDALFRPGKRLLKRLHRWFQKQRLFHSAAHGGVRRRSCFTSAENHLKPRGVWTRDAKDCYPSITPESFQKELKELGFRHDTAVLLTMLCTVRGRIPQGSPVSNDALNLFLWRMDAKLSEMADELGCRYTRVADDVVISKRHGLTGGILAAQVEREFADRGIKVNKKKRRESGFQPNSQIQLVHNINVSRRTGTSIAEDHRTKARLIAENYVLACRSVQPDSIQALAAKRRRLQGYIYYCQQAKYSNVAFLSRQLCAGDLHVAKKLKRLKITAHEGKWWYTTGRKNEPLRIARIWRQRRPLRRRQLDLEEDPFQYATASAGLLASGSGAPAEAATEFKI